MKEQKPYRDPYTDIKRTSPMSGPWRKEPKYHIPSIVLACAIGVCLALILFIGLSS
jgi:hypothetical protein